MLGGCNSEMMLIFSIINYAKLIVFLFMVIIRYADHHRPVADAYPLQCPNVPIYLLS